MTLDYDEDTGSEDCHFPFSGAITVNMNMVAMQHDDDIIGAMVALYIRSAGD